MGMYFECELKKIDIDEVLSNVRYIEPEDLVVLYREKIRRLESALKNSEDDNIRRSEMNKELSDKVECLGNNNRELLKENDKLRQDNKEISDNIKKLRTQCSTSVGQRNKYYELYKQLTVENRRLHRGFAVLDLDNFIKEGVRERCFKLQAENEELKTQSSSLQKENVRLVEENKRLIADLMMENRRLLQEQASLETQINILNANSDAYRKDVDQLTRENKKLIEERDALWAETQHLDKIYKQLLNEKKRLQENFEELKASSDLSMTAELAEIFAEFTDKDKENRDDLSVKIDEFREKYQFE